MLREFESNNSGSLEAFSRTFSSFVSISVFLISSGTNEIAVRRQSINPLGIRHSYGIFLVFLFKILLKASRLKSVSQVSAYNTEIEKGVKSEIRENDFLEHAIWLPVSKPPAE